MYINFLLLYFNEGCVCVNVNEYVICKITECNAIIFITCNEFVHNKVAKLKNIYVTIYHFLVMQSVWKPLAEFRRL